LVIHIFDIDAWLAVPGRIEVFQFGFVLEDGEREPVVTILDGAEVEPAALEEMTIQEVLGVGVEELDAEGISLHLPCPKCWSKLRVSA
jgi:hypothetical protein